MRQTDNQFPIWDGIGQRLEVRIASLRIDLLRPRACPALFLIKRRPEPGRRLIIGMLECHVGGLLKSVECLIQADLGGFVQRDDPTEPRLLFSVPGTGPA